jgi:uncharacterized membrane protein (UPF0127 family)
MNKIIVIFGIIFAIFVGVVFFQFSGQLGAKSPTVTPGTSVTIDKQTFKTTVVKTQQDQEIGLSKYTSLPQDQGMLFVFNEETYPSFWMKDMKFAIDIIFINNDKIVSIAENVQPPKNKEETLPIYQPEGPVDSVLEINAGLAKKYSIKKGATVKIEL